MRGRLESSKGKFECLTLKGSKADSLSRQVKSIGNSPTSVPRKQSRHALFFVRASIQSLQIRRQTFFASSKSLVRLALSPRSHHFNRQTASPYSSSNQSSQNKRITKTKILSSEQSIFDLEPCNLQTDRSSQAKHPVTNQRGIIYNEQSHCHWNTYRLTAPDKANSNLFLWNNFCSGLEIHQQGDQGSNFQPPSVQSLHQTPRQSSSRT